LLLIDFLRSESDFFQTNSISNEGAIWGKSGDQVLSILEQMIRSIIVAKVWKNRKKGIITVTRGKEGNRRGHQKEKLKQSIGHHYGAERSRDHRHQQRRRAERARCLIDVPRREILNG
jgi:hypothetical protein